MEAILYNLATQEVFNRIINATQWSEKKKNGCHIFKSTKLTNPDVTKSPRVTPNM